MKLIGELKKRVEAASSKDEARAIIAEAGMELKPDELDMVSGGVDFDTQCSIIYRTATADEISIWESMAEGEERVIAGGVASNGDWWQTFARRVGPWLARTHLRGGVPSTVMCDCCGVYDASTGRII